MANLEVNTTISAPAQIDIQLVRADVMQMSATFRIFFEIFLALTFTLLGNILSTPNLTNLHWISLVVSGLCTIAFLVLSIRKQREAMRTS